MIRIRPADRHGNHVKAACDACGWQGRPRPYDRADRAETDGRHHEEKCSG